MPCNRTRSEYTSFHIVLKSRSLFRDLLVFRERNEIFSSHAGGPAGGGARGARQVVT